MLAPITPLTVEFTVPGHIVPWARAGGGKTTFKFTPKKQRSYGAVLRDYAALAMRGKQLMDGPLELRLLAIYPWPKSMTPRKRAVPGAEWKVSKPDGDNITKIIKDALNKIVWTDDARVASWHGWKKYGDTPRLVVVVTELVGTPA